MLNPRSTAMLLPVLLVLLGCRGDPPPPGDDSAEGSTPGAPVSADGPAEADSAAEPPEEDPEPIEEAVEPAVEPLTGEVALARLRERAAEIAARDEYRVDRVKVQHLLVAFAGTGVRGVSRSREEAEQLAAELYCRAEAGEDFDALVKEFTDDSHPGTYGMVGSGEAPRGWYARSGMVSAFGDVGWRLQVGELGVAAYDPRGSKYGWHLILRTE